VASCWADAALSWVEAPVCWVEAETCSEDASVSCLLAREIDTVRFEAR